MREENVEGRWVKIRNGLELTGNVSALLLDGACILGFLGNSGRLKLLPISATHTVPPKSPGTIQWEGTEGGKS